MTPLTLTLFAVAMRQHDKPGDVTRVWKKDLTVLVGRRFKVTDLPEVVTADPGYIGGNLSIYLPREWDAWAPAFPGMTEDDVFDAMDAARLDYRTPLPAKVAKDLPSRMLPDAPRPEPTMTGFDGWASLQHRNVR